MGNCFASNGKSGQYNGKESERDYDEECSQFMGTTIVSLKLKERIMVGVDSRGSNEYEQGPLLPNWKLSIRDDVYKFHHLSSNIVAVMAGSHSHCKAMCDEVENLISSGREDSVRHAYDQVLDYLQQELNRNSDSRFGVVIVGWDEHNGYQIYRAYKRGANIETQENVADIAVQGSGSTVAERYVRQHYKYDMPDETAKDLLFQSVFQATLSDKYTGGSLRIYTLRKDGQDKIIWDNNETKNALESYSSYYPLSEQDKTLFVLYPFDHDAFTSSDLISQFRNYGAEASKCQLVAQCESEGICYYFHRLIFAAATDARQVLSKVQSRGIASNGYVPHILKCMYHTQLNSVRGNQADTVYVGQSSWELLQCIITKSTVKYNRIPR